jgi:hypothetical protein
MVGMNQRLQDFILGMVLGFALGNFLPDPTDYVYWTAIGSGAILDPLTAFMTYYGWSFLFWGSVFTLITIGIREHVMNGREAVWIVSGIIIASTLLLILTVSSIMGEYAIFFDILMSFAGVLSVLYVEQKLTWSNIRGAFGK